MKGCEKATYLIEKSNHTKLTFWERFYVKMHVFMCPPCRRYSGESENLNNALKNCIEDKKFPEESKVELKEKLLK